MLSALDRCEEKENTAQVVCSTAHRVKGREWDFVRLDPDFEIGFRRAERAPEDQRTELIEAESRLLYVAMTRARLAVHLPREIQKRFGLKNTSAEVLGASLQSDDQPGSTGSAGQPPEMSAVSPFHSGRKDDSEEMTALRRFFS